MQFNLRSAVSSVMDLICRSGTEARAPLSLFLGLLAILEICLTPIFLRHHFQRALGRFMRRKGCLSATDAFKRS